MWHGLRAQSNSCRVLGGLVDTFWDVEYELRLKLTTTVNAIGDGSTSW